MMHESKGQRIGKAPSLHLFHTTMLQRREEIVLAVFNSRFHVCTSLALRPMTVVFGLGTRLCVRMRTTLENGVLRNRQQPGNS